MNSISNQYAKKLFFPTMNKQIQIHFYTNIIPPYRHSLFNSMNRNISLHVHTASRKEADRGWTDFSNEREFQLTEHNLRKLKLGEKYFYFPNLSWLKIYKNDVIIIGGWEQPANIILIFFCLAKRKRFYLFSESTDNDAGISSSGIIRKVKKSIFESAKGIFTVGLASTENIKNLGIPENKIYKGFNAIDYEWWSAKNSKREIRSTNSGIRFIYVGQLISRKRVNLIIETFSKISRNIDSLSIVGSGPLENELKELAENIGSNGNIEFFKAIESEILREVYLRHDVLVLPSEAEVWGMVALEALACELSVIASSNCGVTREIENLPNVIIVDSNEDFESAFIATREVKNSDEVKIFFQHKSIQNVANFITSVCISEGKYSHEL